MNARAAREAAEKIYAFDPEWQSVTEDMYEEIIQAAIDDSAKPLVEALERIADCCSKDLYSAAAEDSCTIAREALAKFRGEGGDRV